MADTTASVPRIPTIAENDFRNLKKEKTKYYKHECHQKNLKLYREKGMIPEGLKLSLVPHLSDITDKFQARWNLILRRASESLLDLLISHHEVALEVAWGSIIAMEKNIKEKFCEELTSQIIQLSNDIAKKDKEKAQEKAQYKFVKRSALPPRRSLDDYDGIPREEFRDRKQFGGSGRRPKARSNSQRSYVGMGRGRKTPV